jgi:hypothetical protein
MGPDQVVTHALTPASCFATMQPAVLSEPLSRQRQPAHEATAERAADRDQYPGILEESDHLTGAYDPGSWASCPRQWPKRTQLRGDDGYGSVVLAEG